LALLRGPAPSITALTRRADLDLDAVRLGLRIELEQIQIAYEEGRISRPAAQKMRENVYLMQLDLEDTV
jgi:CPA1 family monovalent cation:H+ antiporter